MKKVNGCLWYTTWSNQDVSFGVRTKKRDNVDTVDCVTGQHREMLDQVLNVFNVIPDYDLSVMKSKQTLFDVTINILEKSIRRSKTGYNFSSWW